MKKEKISRYRFLLNRIYQLGHNSNPIVVDCGCSECNRTKILFDEPDFTVLPFDVSKKAIKQCYEKWGIKATHANILHLPLFDDYVDIFICSETLEHLDKKYNDQVSKEIKRVCKQGALICITVPLHKHSLEDPLHKQYLKPNKIKNMFKDCDLEYKDKYYKNPDNKKKSGNLVLIFRKNS